MVSLGKCYYCKKDVIHEKPYDYGAYTKKWDKKQNKYIIKDVWHMKCYCDAVCRISTTPKAETQRQMTIFEM